jgi:hypothetical protein
MFNSTLSQPLLPKIVVGARSNLTTGKSVAIATLSAQHREYCSIWSEFATHFGFPD